MYSVIVKKSDIDNLGLFSLTSIPKNSKICDYIGDEMSLKDFKEKFGDYKSNCLNTYRMKRINRIIVAKNYPNNLVNYINESLTPNVILKKRALYSLKEIKEGEELFLRYPDDYYRDYTLSINSYNKEDF